MNKWILTFACVSFLFIQLSTSKGFNGGWTDDVEAGGIGGVFYICVKDDKVTLNGLYSENGLVVGTISDKTANGRFLEGGGDSVYCNSGQFQFTLADDEASFSGFYICDSNPSVQQSWNSTKIIEDKPNPKQCALLADSGSCTGHWYVSNSTVANRLDFCQTSSDYKLSFKANETTSQFGEGVTAYDGVVSSGIIYTENNDGSLPGTSLWYVSVDGDLYHIYWAGLGQKYIKKVNDPQYHSYVKYRYAGETTNTDCRSLNYLVDQPYDYYPIDDELKYYNYFYYYNLGLSSSSQIAISFVVMGALMLVAMF